MKDKEIILKALGATVIHIEQVNRTYWMSKPHWKLEVNRITPSNN